MYVLFFTFWFPISSYAIICIPNWHFCLPHVSFLCPSCVPLVSLLCPSKFPSSSFQVSNFRVFIYNWNDITADPVLSSWQLCITSVAELQHHQKSWNAQQNMFIFVFKCLYIEILTARKQIVPTYNTEVFLTNLDTLDKTKTTRRPEMQQNRSQQVGPPFLS